jgi:hypothetical protein
MGEDFEGSVCVSVWINNQYYQFVSIYDHLMLHLPLTLWSQNTSQ